MIGARQSEFAFGRMDRLGVSHLMRPKRQQHHGYAMVTAATIKTRVLMRVRHLCAWGTPEEQRNPARLITMATNPETRAKHLLRKRSQSTAGGNVEADHVI